MVPSSALYSYSDATSALNQGDIVKSLTRQGFSEKEATTLAEAMIAREKGAEYLSPKQNRTLDSYKEDARVQNAESRIVENEQSTMAQRKQKLNAFDENVAIGMGKKALTDAGKTVETNTASTEETAVKSEFEVSAEGKTINTKTGAVVNIQKIDSISEGGEANLTLDDGMVVKASDLSYGSDAEALLIENIGKMKLGNKSISTASANALYQMAKTSITPDMKPFEVASLIKGLEESYVHGVYNFGSDKLTDSNAVAFANELAEEQRKFAYDLGSQDRVSKVEKDQKVIDELKAKGKPSKKSLGKIIFEKGAEVDESTLTKTQKANLNGIKLLAEISSVEFHVFKSEKVGNTFRYTAPDGTVNSANGWYVAGTNEIWVDLNAGNFGEGTMIRTAAHEISHYIKQWSPKKWQAMADLLMEGFSKNGVDTESMLNKQIAKIKRRYSKENMPSEAKLLDMAYEELVSDALSDMLTDGSIVNFMAEIKAKDRTLAQKIMDAIKSLLKKWGLIVEDYKGRELDTAEAQALSQLEDTFKKLQALYQEAFVDANETVAAISTNETVLTESGISVDSDTDAGSIFSVRDLLDDSQREKVAKALATRFDVTKEEAMLWLTAETSLASLILNPKYSQYLDYTADSSEEAIKSNSDYPQGTVDFSNICKKRRDFTEVMNRVLRNFPSHVFMATDLAKIRSIMEEENMEVACAICYVEDRRQLDSIVAQDFIDSLALYREGSKTRPDGKPFNTNQLKALQLIDGDTYTPSIYELISLEGRNSLKDKNPAMNEAWVKFNNARGMQSVRLLLNDAEYKRQILKYNKKTVQSKNDHGGLRIYSFSDMEMFHLIDIIQVITDSAAVGLSLQGYTKVNEYAKAVKDTGEKLNRSLIPKGDLGYHIEDGKVILDFDTVEGIDINHKDFFDSTDNPNVGNIVIGINKKQIQAAMVSKFIDQIIPFHTGQSKEVLGEKGIASWNNYKDAQTEKDLATGNTAKHQINIYTEVFQAAENEGKPITNKVEFVNKFLEVCKENNLEPRFSEFLNTDENGNYVYTEGYHKFLVDFKTFDQNTGEYLPQMPVKPIFDNEYITSLLKDYVKTQKIKDAQLASAMPKVLERITNEIVAPNEKLLSEREQKVDDAVDKAIKQKGNLGEKYNQVKISEFPDDVSKFVSRASEGKINLTGKYIAINGDNIWHEYNRHKDASIEADRQQLPLTVDTIKEAVMAIYAPDIVESLFSTTQNPTQRQSFAYAKKSPNGHYIVVEAVGGNRNPNVVPVMLLQFTEEKWNNMISSGRTLGELLFENDAEKRNSLDVELNKKNRVTVAQFASKEAIANTPRSPQFDDIIPQNSDSVKMLSERDPSTSNRSILANALEGAAQNDIEKNKLAQYKEKIALIETEEQRLSEIQKQLFTKGGVEPEKRKDLQFEAKQIANRINTYDRQLLNLEATTALKNVLSREKALAMKRQKAKDAEAMRQYKEKVAKTTMRHKIQKVVSELNQLLLRGTKDKHVMIGLQKAVAEALDAVNMDTVGAEDRLKVINENLQKETDPIKFNDLLSSYRRIMEQGGKMSDKLTKLKNAYNDIKNSDDPLIANSHDEVIASRLEYIAEKVGDTPLRDMTLEQLEDVYDMYKMVLTTIRNSNKSFKNAKNESIATLGNRVMMEVEKVGGKKKLRLKGTKFIKMFTWNNLKPVYAFNRIGSETLR